MKKILLILIIQLILNCMKEQLMNKANERFNFIKHKWFDTEDIKNHIKNYDKQWTINTSRQKNFYPHKNTKTVFIYESDLNWKLNSLYLSTLMSDEIGRAHV